MHPHSEIVRSVLRVAYKIVLIAESFDDAVPGPRMSQIQFGRYMARTDPYTADSIAADIVAHFPPVLQFQIRSSIVDLIRGHWNESPRTQKHSPFPIKIIDNSVHILGLVHHQLNSNCHDLMRIGSVLKTWVSIAKHFPGREAYSLREDYDNLAQKFYLNNEKIICDFSAISVKLVKLKKLR